MMKLPTLQRFFAVLLICLLVILLASCSAVPSNSKHDTTQHSDPFQIEQPESDSETIVVIEEVVVGLLLLAAIVSVVTQRLRIPYTVGLVLVGFLLALVGQVPILNVTPELILALLVPPLVFEAAFHLDFNELRKDLGLILLLAVPGVIITMLVVGSLVSLSAGISFPLALLFGSLISATDPVAVVALFRTMGAPRRLQVLLEGESLLNDGTSIVLFNLMLAVVLTGKFNLATSTAQFIIISGGGLLIGAVFGVIVSQVIGRIDNYLIETTLTTVLAYGSYLVAEYVFDVSGVLAVVAAGLASGQIGPRAMSPTTRIVVFNFWEYVAFLSNSFVFLIIGLQIDLDLLVNNAGAIFWGILAVLISRAVSIYGLSWLGKSIPMRWKNVLFWGGLRGAIGLALALTLSPQIPGRSQLQAMAFGVVFFTLVVEGLTMGPLMRHMGISGTSEARKEYELRHAKAVAVRAAEERLRRLNREGLISDYTWNMLAPVMKKRSKDLTEGVKTALQMDPDLHKKELMQAWRESLSTERSTLTRLFMDKVISEDIYTELSSEVDYLLSEQTNPWPELEGKIPVEDEG